MDYAAEPEDLAPYVAKVNRLLTNRVDNATFLLNEYHVDGFRYDEVTVIDDHGGWDFCKELTNAVKRVKPEAIHIAEYWRDDPSWVIRDTRAGGAGFDAVWYPGMRKGVRNAIAQAAGGRDAAVSMDGVRDALYRPNGFDAAWRTVQFLETHDRQRLENTNDREPRSRR